jgi:hypothetical protein
MPKICLIEKFLESFFINFRYFERNGVKYDDNVSEFSVDVVPNEDCNYLDMYISEANLDEKTIKKMISP